MKATLTDSVVNKAVRSRLPGQRVDLSDKDCRGLHRRISQTGKTSWSWIGKNQASRTRRFPLGDFPHVTIAAARTAARAMAHSVKMNGAGPIAERAQTREAAEQVAVEDANTLRAMFIAYGASPKAPKSWPDGSRRVLRVFASLLDHPCAGLTIDDVQRAVNNFTPLQSGAFAVRTARPAFKWGAVLVFDSARVSWLTCPRRLPSTSAIECRAKRNCRGFCPCCERHGRHTPSA